MEDINTSNNLQNNNNIQIDYEKLANMVASKMMPNKKEQVNSFNEFSNTTKENKEDNIYRKQVEKDIAQENLIKEKEKETEELTEFRLTFDNFLNKYDYFIDNITKREIKLIQDSDNTQSYKMGLIKSTLLKNCFQKQDNYNKLIDSDKQEIDKFLSLKEDEKTKEYKKYFAILERFLNNEKQLYTQKKIAEANRNGYNSSLDKAYEKMESLANKSAKKFLNVEDFDFKVLKK